LNLGTIVLTDEQSHDRTVPAELNQGTIATADHRNHDRIPTAAWFKRVAVSSTPSSFGSQPVQAWKRAPSRPNPSRAVRNSGVRDGPKTSATIAAAEAINTHA
jgi:hypothetical protein